MLCDNRSGVYVGVVGTVACITGALILGTQWASLDLATKVGTTATIAIAQAAFLATLVKQNQAIHLPPQREPAAIAVAEQPPAVVPQQQAPLPYCFNFIPSNFASLDGPKVVGWDQIQWIEFTRAASDKPGICIHLGDVSAWTNFILIAQNQLPNLKALYIMDSANFGQNVDTSHFVQLAKLVEERRISTKLASSNRYELQIFTHRGGWELESHGPPKVLRYSPK